MIHTISKYMVILGLLGLSSCGKEEIPSDIEFTQECDLADRTRNLKNMHGTLHFTDSLPTGPLPEPIFIIYTQSQGLLPITICNMPSDFQMAEGDSREVMFGGRIVVYSDHVDATSVPIELDYLKFQ